MEVPLSQLLYAPDARLRELGLLQAQAQGADLEALLAPCRALAVYMGLEQAPLLTQWQHLMEHEVLYIRSNKRWLTHLPSAIGYFSHLERLELSYNQLSSLPTALGRLRRLRGLHLSFNQFETLPDVIGSLPSLHHFSVGGNKIKALPESLMWAPRLQSLHLTQNQLQDLPYAPKAWAELEELDLRLNQFQTLPDWLLDLPKLQKVNALFNPIHVNRLSPALRARIGDGPNAWLRV